MTTITVAATKRRGQLGEEELQFGKRRGSQAAVRAEDNDDGSRKVVGDEGSGQPQWWMRHSGCQKKMATGRGRVAFREHRGSQAVVLAEEDSDGSRIVVGEEGSC